MTETVEIIVQQKQPHLKKWEDMHDMFDHSERGLKEARKDAKSLNLKTKYRLIKRIITIHTIILL